MYFQELARATTYRHMKLFVDFVFHYLKSFGVYFNSLKAFTLKFIETAEWLPWMSELACMHCNSRVCDKAELLWLFLVFICQWHIMVFWKSVWDQFFFFFSKTEESFPCVRIIETIKEIPNAPSQTLKTKKKHTKINFEFSRIFTKKHNLAQFFFQPQDCNFHC